MSRLQFGVTTLDTLVDSDAVNLTRLEGSVTVWDSMSGGTQITDLLDDQESAVTEINIPDSGIIPVFFGPDDSTTDVLWIEHTSLTDRVAASPLRNDSEKDLELLNVEADIGSVDDMLLLDDRADAVDADFTVATSDISDLDTRATSAQGTLDVEEPKYRAGEIIFYGRQTVAQTLADSTTTAIDLDTIDINKASWSGASPSQVTLTEAGKYILYGSVSYSGNSSGTFRNALFHKDTVAVDGSMGREIEGVGGIIVSTGPTYAESDGTNVFELMARHNVGGNLDTFPSGSYEIAFLVKYVGP